MKRGAICLIFVLSIVVRFWRIDAPFDDLWSWRQSDVASIARNYFENGFQFGQPQIDWAGNSRDLSGLSFPFFRSPPGCFTRLLVSTNGSAGH